MRDGIKDLSVITTIPYHTLQKLFDKLCWVVCDGVQASELDHEEFASIDIGIGTIDIAVKDDQIQYRFVPSNKLEDSVRETLVSKKNPLQINLEEALVKKIVNAYKEFF